VQARNLLQTTSITGGDNRIEKQSLDYAIIKNNPQLLKTIFKIVLLNAFYRLWFALLPLQKCE
jgi:hypothetical protein